MFTIMDRVTVVSGGSCEHEPGHGACMFKGEKGTVVQVSSPQTSTDMVEVMMDSDHMRVWFHPWDIKPNAPGDPQSGEPTKFIGVDGEGTRED